MAAAGPGGRTKVPIEKVLLHEGFSLTWNGDARDDIALVKLTRRLPVSPGSIMTICMLGGDIKGREMYMAAMTKRRRITLKEHENTQIKVRRKRLFGNILNCICICSEVSRAKRGWEEEEEATASV